MSPLPSKIGAKTLRSLGRAGNKRPGAQVKARQLKSESSPAGDDPPSKDAAHKDSFPVVAIGASAGGLEAYTEFFKALPANTGMAFVVVQHLDPNHRSLLADIISKTAKMPVEEVTSGQKLKPNCAYVIPHNTLMAIVEGSFTLTPRGKEPRQHLSINFFMRSLAQERQSGAIGIVLSGTGADGTLGLEDIKAEGALHLPRLLNRPSTTACHAAPSILGAWTSSCRQRRLRKSCSGSPATLM